MASRLTCIAGIRWIGVLLALLTMSAADAHAKGTGTSTPTVATGLSGVVDLDASGDQTCAVLGTGQVACWGGVAPGTGADPLPKTFTRTAPFVVPGLSDAKRVSGRCAIKTDGTVWCWGASWLGAAPDPADAPAQVVGIDGAVAIDGETTICVLRTDATVWCWGWDREGQTGRPSDQSTSYIQATPQPVPGIAAATSISVGQVHVCATLADGALWCWGNTPMQDGTDSAPHAIAGIAGATQSSTSIAATCAVSQNGEVRCYGDNAWGEMGVRPDGYATGAAAVAGLPAMVQVSTAEKHTCGVTSTGDSWCWGLQDDGRLGNPVYGGDGTSESPVRVLGLSGIRSVTTGNAHTCALLADGTVRCFGSDALGQLGNGDEPLPADPPPGTPGATIPSASSGGAAPPTPQSTTTAPKPAKKVPTLARSGRTVTLTAFALTVRKGKQCPARVTVTIRRKRTTDALLTRRLRTTVTGSACTLTATIKLSASAARRTDLALVVTGTGVGTRTRPLGAA